MLNSVTIYGNYFYQISLFLTPLLFLVLQLFRAEGVSKRIQRNLVKKFNRSGQTEAKNLNIVDLKTLDWKAHLLEGSP